MSVNKAIILGNLGKDPEVRFLDSGKAVANFTVATSETWKDKEGAKQEKTEWHRVTAWGKQAEVIGEFFRKGDPIYLEGRIETRKYTDKEGVEKYSTDIQLNQFSFVGGKKGKESTGTANAGTPKEDEDIPF